VSSSKTYKTEAIVIKRLNFGEADKILTLFSKHYGKISCIAKGIRKLTSRKAGALELFNCSTVFLVKGKNLDIITEAKIVESFKNFENNLEGIATAYQFCELVDYLTVVEQRNRRIFQLLKNALRALKKTEKDKFNSYVFHFKKKILKLTGFGFPENLQGEEIDLFIEDIVEKRMNSNSILKVINKTE